jgi:putative aminopeptidase FrvX
MLHAHAAAAKEHAVQQTMAKNARQFCMQSETAPNGNVHYAQPGKQSDLS